MPRLADDTATSRPLPFADSTSPVTHVHLDGLPTAKKRPPLTRAGVKLTESEIRKACGDRYPPILSLDIAAEISGYTRATLKKLICEGRFKTCVKRRKPVLFWRDRFVQELMQG